MLYGLLYAFTISMDHIGAEIMFSSKQHTIKRLKWKINHIVFINQKGGRDGVEILHLNCVSQEVTWYMLGEQID